MCLLLGLGFLLGPEVVLSNFARTVPLQRRCPMVSVLVGLESERKRSSVVRRTERGTYVRHDVVALFVVSVVWKCDGRFDVAVFHYSLP